MSTPRSEPHQSSEYILLRAKGSAYRYSKERKTWEKLADHCPLMIVHDRSCNAHRIIAQAADDKNVVVLSSHLCVGLEYELRKAFLQWKDGPDIWGLRFADASVAERFSTKMKDALTHLDVPLAPPAHAQMAVSARAAAAYNAEVTLLVPRMPPRGLFNRTDTLAIPESNSCCVCGAMRNELLLKQVEGGKVEGDLLRLNPKLDTARLCTKCWIQNLKLIHLEATKGQ